MNDTIAVIVVVVVVVSIVVIIFNKDKVRDKVTRAVLRIKKFVSRK